MYVRGSGAGRGRSEGGDGGGRGGGGEAAETVLPKPKRCYGVSVERLMLDKHAEEEGKAKRGA